MSFKSGESKSQRNLSRRAFIQQASLGACTLSLAGLPFAQNVLAEAQNYTQALADATGRKLALLIGIDEYPDQSVPPSGSGSSQLLGATTDVKLQRELLIYRFGFSPSDIVCLTNEQATREGIYDAFVSHLQQQATADDVVVLHFSGYGSQVRIKTLREDVTEDIEGKEAILRSLVPFDGNIPTDNSPILNDILEIELKALLSQLKTKNVTTILDVGFVDAMQTLSGGLRSRTRSEVITGQLPTPFDLLAKQLSFKEQDPFPGILLRGSNVGDIVFERQWNNLNAGAFTYALTQFLWTAPAPVTTQRSLAKVQERLLRWGGTNQQPSRDGNPTPIKTSTEIPVYGSLLINSTRGEGVITKLSNDGKAATLWLGGVTPHVLEYLEPPTVMICDGRRMEIRSLDGLIGKAKLIDGPVPNGTSLYVGQPVFESVRAFPKDPDLIVALDSRLKRLERVDATSGLKALGFVKSTSKTQRPSDCLLGKPDDTTSNEFISSGKTSAGDLKKIGYGLFSLTGTLIPGTFSPQQEAIKSAVTRLNDNLRSLMALKMLRLSENRATSTLPIRVTLEQVEADENRLLISRQIFKKEQTVNDVAEGFMPEVPVGSRVRYRLFNDSDHPIYYALINVDPKERLSAFRPAIGPLSVPVKSRVEEQRTATPTTTSTNASLVEIAPGSSATIPGAGLDWAVELPTGIVETYVICTTRPLTNTLDLLLSNPNSRGQRVSPLPNPLEFVRSILSDLDHGSDSKRYVLDMAEWATLNFTHKAV